MTSWDGDDIVAVNNNFLDENKLVDIEQVYCHTSVQIKGKMGLVFNKNEYWKMNHTYLADNKYNADI